MAKRTISIRGMISLSFIVLMMSTLITIGYITFSNWKKSSEGMILKMENASSQDIFQKIEQQINLPYRINANNQSLIKNGIVDITNQNERDIFFTSIIESSNENIYSFSYGLENGDYYGARRNGNISKSIKGMLKRMDTLIITR